MVVVFALLLRSINRDWAEDKAKPRLGSFQTPFTGQPLPLETGGVPWWPQVPLGSIHHGPSSTPGLGHPGSHQHQDFLCTTGAFTPYIQGFPHKPARAQDVPAHHEKQLVGLTGWTSNCREYHHLLSQPFLQVAASMLLVKPSGRLQ